jgi:hypothetical protein
MEKYPNYFTTYKHQQVNYYNAPQSYNFAPLILFYFILKI